MILHDPALAMSFPDYGILIPVLDSRAASVLDSLASGSCAGRAAGRTRLVDGIRAAAPILGEAPASLAISRADLERVHNGTFVSRLYGEGSEDGRGLGVALLSAYELIDAEGRLNRYEPDGATKPLSALFSTILSQVAGTYTACRLALSGGDASGPGFCYFLGGGMHHARRDGGSGFCLVNDIMIASARLHSEGRVSLVWIIDVDAHKGDGTAEIALGLREAGSPLALTLSAHMASGWPLDAASLERARREGRGDKRAPLAASDVEIPVEAGQEAEYLPRLREGLAELASLSAGRKPDLAIVVDGADVYEGDGLPSSEGLALSLGACVERDEAILGFLDARGIPSAWLMAGGYGDRAWEPPAAFLNSIGVSRRA
ncbi:MAG: hypothetical protein A2Z99_20605 [Treponema sp. GWB1_62_6]|nr:MAG: hypothetical protein A2Z99_20605 [Treponema sp. GWB1_62_6]